MPSVRSFSMKQYGGQLGTSVPKYSSKPRVIGPPAIGLLKTSDQVARWAGVASLMPGAWAARSAVLSPVSRAVLIGLVVYLFLSSIVDFFAYTQSIVNTAAIPSIAFRFILGILIFLLMRKETGTR